MKRRRPKKVENEKKTFLFLVSNLSFSALLPATHKMLNFGSNSKKTFSDKKIRRFGQNFHVSDKYFDILSFRTKFSTFWTKFLAFWTKISTIRTNIFDILDNFWYFGQKFRRFGQIFWTFRTNFGISDEAARLFFGIIVISNFGLHINL